MIINPRSPYTGGIILYKNNCVGPLFWSLYVARIYSGTSANPSYMEDTDLELCQKVLNLFGANSEVALSYSALAANKSSQMGGKDLEIYTSTWKFSSNGKIIVTRASRCYPDDVFGTLSNVSVDGK